MPLTLILSPGRGDSLGISLSPWERVGVREKLNIILCHRSTKTSAINFVLPLLFRRLSDETKEV
jgi:hypothetical protein